MYYDFSPILMRHAPRETVDAWMSRRNKLEPVKLIPALVQYNLSEDELKVSIISNGWVWSVTGRGVLVCRFTTGRPYDIWNFVLKV